MSDTECEMCEKKFFMEDDDDTLDKVYECNESFIISDGLANNYESCRRCVNCCEGHCINCGGDFEECRGGREFVGYGDRAKCQAPGCENVFHTDTAFCEGFSKCILCKQKYCGKCKTRTDLVNVDCHPKQSCVMKKEL